MMRRKKADIIFIALFFLFSVIVAGMRLHWIHKAVPSTAHVLYTGETRSGRSSQKFPVVEYDTYRGRVETRGTYNLPMEPEQYYAVVYDPDDVESFRLNTPFWLWYDIWSWYRLLIVGIALYYIVFFLVRRSMKQKEAEAALYASLSRELGEQPPPGLFEDEPMLVTEIAEVPKTQQRSRIPRWAKALLLLSVPVVIFAAGETWNIPYTRAIAAVVLLGLIALGSPSDDEETS
jgi:hypothetical protein